MLEFARYTLCYQSLKTVIMIDSPILVDILNNVAVKYIFLVLTLGREIRPVCRLKVHRVVKSDFYTLQDRH